MGPGRTTDLGPGLGASSIGSITRTASRTVTSVVADPLVGVDRLLLRLTDAGRAIRGTA